MVISIKGLWLVLEAGVELGGIWMKLENIWIINLHSIVVIYSKTNNSLVEG